MEVEGWGCFIGGQCSLFGVLVKSKGGEGRWKYQGGWKGGEGKEGRIPRKTKAPWLGRYIHKRYIYSTSPKHKDLQPFSH